eukprot:SAG31_NODE_2115_length_6416_cov_20.056989_5_plen_60_part_00
MPHHGTDDKSEWMETRTCRRELCHAIWLGELATTMTHAEIDYEHEFGKAVEALKQLGYL